MVKVLEIESTNIMVIFKHITFTKEIQEKRRSIKSTTEKHLCGLLPHIVLSIVHLVLLNLFKIPHHWNSKHINEVY